MWSRLVLALALSSCARFEVELLDAPGLDARAGRCRGHACACANGLDDDGDGAADGLDDACLGALDDDEAALGMADARGASCLDCFFDANEGGDEGCRYPASCRADGTSAGGCGVCTASPACLAACRPLVPNGCDCFGCCEVHAAGETRTVVLAEGCTVATLADETACPPCVPSAWCVNPCERCELCPGRATLPTDCAPSCGDGERVCVTEADCAATGSCVLGCCIAAP